MTIAGMYDPDRELLQELLAVLDGHWRRIDAAIRTSPDADAHGEFDRGEHLVGLGFVACQTYIAATCGRSGFSKPEGLALGDEVAPGITRAALVNHAANYWKHRLDPGDDARRDRTMLALDAAGIAVHDSYPLSNVLAALAGPCEAPLLRLGDIMVEWGRLVGARGRRTRS
jgi:hypothetical protein